MTAIKAEELRGLLDYSIVSGRFYWKVPSKYSRMKLGEPAGHLKTNGYVTIRANGSEYKAHRLAWLWVTGEMPSSHIDHINRNRSSNGWHNLREASPAENAANRSISPLNTLGFKNVWKHRGKYRARVMKDGKFYYGRSKDTPEAASMDAAVLRQKMYGQFAT
jgi:hypothetical protein